MSDEIITSAEDGVLFITLNRPKAKNAVNLALAKAMVAATDELESNDDLRVAVITGSEGTFCSGMDLKAFVTGELPMIEGRGFAGLTEYRSSKPIIAAIEGFALAGGFEIAISCDLIVAADNAMFGVPEVKRGLVAAGGGVVKLPRQIPSRIAMELALTGDFISSARAYELGLINEVVPAGTALDAAKAMAAKIVANGPLAVAASLRAVSSTQDWSTDEMFDKQNEFVMPIFASEDAIEGATAFSEKRAPNWKGK